MGSGTTTTTTTAERSSQPPVQLRPFLKLRYIVRTELASFPLGQGSWCNAHSWPDHRACSPVKHHEAWIGIGAHVQHEALRVFAQPTQKLLIGFGLEHGGERYPLPCCRDVIEGLSTGTLPHCVAQSGTHPKYAIASTVPIAINVTLSRILFSQAIRAEPPGDVRIIRSPCR